MIVDASLVSDAVFKYADTVLRAAFQYARNRADAEDVMQDVFLALLEKRPLIHDENHLKAWLIRAAINKSKDYLRSQKRRQAAESEPRDEGRSYDFDGGDGEVLDGVKKLPLKDRFIVYLHYYEGYNAKEIAGILLMKENTVHARLKRARAKLKEILDP